MAKITIPVTLELTDSASEVQKAILTGFRQALNIAIPKAIPSIQQNIKRLIRHEITTSDEYEALVNGPLDAHFGFHKGTAHRRLDAIINVFEEQIFVKHITVNVRGNKLTGGLQMGVIAADFLKAVSIPEAHVIYNRVLIEGNSVKRFTEDMPWLEWLLFEGDSVRVHDYRISFDQEDGSFNSRSGDAVMVKESGSIWRVPPGASGTITSNWITRVFAVTKRLDDILTKIVQHSLQKEL